MKTETRIAIAAAQDINLVDIEVGAELYNPKTRQIDHVASVKGRWVKLSSGHSISRADALAGIDEWFTDCLELHPEWFDGFEKESRNIVPQSYRVQYVRTKSANGNASLTCGDSVAELMAGLSVDRAEAVATFAMGEPRAWPHLNAGQRVMNARNAVRRALKDGFVTIDDIRAALSGE